MAATWPSPRFRMAKARGLPRGSGQGCVIFPAWELVEDVTMETLSWFLNGVLRARAPAVPRMLNLAVSTTNQSLLPNFILTGREMALLAAVMAHALSLGLSG